jgi:hypothetical protein
MALLLDTHGAGAGEAEIMLEGRGHRNKSKFTLTIAARVPSDKLSGWACKTVQ